MKPKYREDKATQAAAVFIDLEGGAINHMKLIKLLYFAERSAVLSWGRPITFDSYVSMKHGPVMSLTLDNINSERAPGSATYWQSFISERAAHSVRLGQGPVPKDHLSRAEVDLLETTYSQFGHMNQYELADYAHKHFSEWKDPSGSTLPISIRDILLGEGFSAEEAAEVEHDLHGEAVAGRYRVS